MSVEMSSGPLSGPLLHVKDGLTQEGQIPEEPVSDPELASTYSPNSPLQRPKRWCSKLSAVSRQMSQLHRETPLLKRLPSYVIFPITLLILVNGAAWAIVGIILRYYQYPHFHTPLTNRTLVAPVTLAYTFGLRHALDADHIAAIDNVPDLSSYVNDRFAGSW
jgi:High-affinity nickel-transport protein